MEVVVGETYALLAWTLAIVDRRYIGSSIVHGTYVLTYTLDWLSISRPFPQSDVIERKLAASLKLMWRVSMIR